MSVRSLIEREVGMAGCQDALACQTLLLLLKIKDCCVGAPSAIVFSLIAIGRATHATRLLDASENRSSDEASRHGTG